MIIRPINKLEIAEANEIYEKAREFMRAAGNNDQWNSAYPGIKDIKEGMEEGHSYVCCDGDEVVATFYFETDANDPTYRVIYDGEWKSTEPYAVMHRVAVKYHGRGIIDFCIEECFKRFPNLRIDTHKDNIPMQKVLARAGFEYCGIIHLANGDERMAYQKLK